MTKAAAKAHRAVRAAKKYQAGLPAQSRQRRQRNIGVVLPIGTKLIQAITEIQLGICPYCDDWLEFDPSFDMSHPLRPSIDHVMPRGKGGGHLGNKLVMHRECNCAKGDRLPNGCERIWLAAVTANLGL